MHPCTCSGNQRTKQLLKIRTNLAVKKKVLYAFTKNKVKNHLSERNLQNRRLSLEEISYLQQASRNLDETLQKKINLFQDAWWNRCDNIKQTFQSVNSSNNPCIIKALCKINTIFIDIYLHLYA